MQQSGSELLSPLLYSILHLQRLRSSLLLGPILPEEFFIYFLCVSYFDNLWHFLTCQATNFYCAKIWIERISFIWLNLEFIFLPESIIYFYCDCSASYSAFSRLYKSQRIMHTDGLLLPTLAHYDYLPPLPVEHITKTIYGYYQHHWLLCAVISRIAN